MVQDRNAVSAECFWNILYPGSKHIPKTNCWFDHINKIHYNLLIYWTTLLYSSIKKIILLVYLNKCQGLKTYLFIINDENISRNLLGFYSFNKPQSYTPNLLDISFLESTYNNKHYCFDEIRQRPRKCSKYQIISKHTFFILSGNRLNEHTGIALIIFLNRFGLQSIIDCFH